MGSPVRSLGCASVVSLLVLVSAAWADPPHYVLTPLLGIGQVPGSPPSSKALAINNLGQVVGGTTTSTGGDAFVYSNGTMRDLGALDGTDGAEATGINDAGQIVGVASTLTPTDHAVAMSASGGGMHDLGLAFATDGRFAGYSINSAGTIVGTNGNSAVIYSGGTTQVIPTPAKYAYAGATGINDSNQVIGYVTNPLYFQPFLYDMSSGTLQMLVHSGVEAGATGINDMGHIAGWWISSDNRYHSMVYENGAWSDLAGASPGGQTQATAINDLDEVVGWAKDSSETDGGYGFVYLSGMMYNLNDLIVNPQPNWPVVEPTAINDAGQIVGGLYSDGVYEGFLLTPVSEPEPSSALVFGIIVSGLLLKRRRFYSQPARWSSLNAGGSACDPY